jgi:phospholipase C
MRRREFIRNAALVGAGTALWGGLPDDVEARRPPGGSILDRPATSCPIDTVVVCMMENRSFDHYMGWLASDEAYLEEGRSRWGRGFRVRGSTDEAYRKPNGTIVETFPQLSGGDPNPWRGCGHPDPGHGWNAGRAQRDGGFVAAGSNNDEFACSWFGGELEFYTAISRRFTIFDRYHCSVLGPTYPNREYLHSAQSGGLKNNAFPGEVGYPNGFPWTTIWDKLGAAGVPARYYYVDLPTIALWGPRLSSYSATAARYFTDAAAGQLPNVVFLDPGFLGATRTDEHPHGDVRDGQRLMERYFRAFVESPHWETGVFILTYDEWGGFFDHVRPPKVRDDRRSPIDDENFGQLGFRVPTRVMSPFARRNFVDHRLYDHTSILRFLEWRFLAAPAEGKGVPGNWHLTTRDRYANNLGWSLKADDPDPELDFGTFPDPGTSAGCGASLVDGRAATNAAPVPDHDFARGLEIGAFDGYEIGNWLPWK